jgi:hypothetical protein
MRQRWGRVPDNTARVYLSILHEHVHLWEVWGDRWQTEYHCHTHPLWSVIRTPHGIDPNIGHRLPMPILLSCITSTDLPLVRSVTRCHRGMLPCLPRSLHSIILCKVTRISRCGKNIPFRAWKKHTISDIVTMEDFESRVWTCTVHMIFLYT